MNGRIGFVTVAVLGMLARLVVGLSLTGIALHAQDRLPALAVTLIAQWDPNSPDENVVSYLVQVGDACCLTVPNILNPDCACIQAPVTFFTRGAVTVTVTAQNYVLPGKLQNGPPAIYTAYLAGVPLPASQLRLLQNTGIAGH